MTQRTDILIAGGGLVGMTLAIALARMGLYIRVVDKVPAATQTLPEFDGRVSAVALSSKYLLDAIGVWPHMADDAQPIEDIRVADGYSPVFLHYDHREVGMEPFGYIVENRHTRMALAKAAEALPNLQLDAPAEVISYDPAARCAMLADETEVHTQLLIAAEGKHSPLREKMGIPVIKHDYSQTAIVATIAHTAPHHGLAVERFFPAGPFAVLPMLENRSSLVWAEPRENAAAYLAMKPAQMEWEITTRMGGYLGDISLVGPVFSYPLSLTHATRYTAPRFALVGDAAHAMHPIAGQGVNLGWRDVAVLAEIIQRQMRLGLDIGSDIALEGYQRWRRFDNVTMLAVTDGLTRLFSNHSGVLKFARGLGFAAVGAMPPVKRFFMRHAMGVTGDLAPLLRPTHL